MDYNEYLEHLWDLYQPAYLEWCDEHGVNPKNQDFAVWCEDQDLIPEPVYD